MAYHAGIKLKGILTFADQRYTRQAYPNTSTRTLCLFLSRRETPTAHTSHQIEGLANRQIPRLTA